MYENLLFRKTNDVSKFFTLSIFSFMDAIYDSNQLSKKLHTKNKPKEFSEFLKVNNYKLN